jgi:hypothetical protein
MRQRLHRRLESLEVASAAVRAELERERERANRPDPKERIRWFLNACKVEQMPNESMMETWARALHISPRELSGLLKARIDPIQKYLKEIGLLEELRKKKAAEIVLSGSRNLINGTL